MKKNKTNIDRFSKIMEIVAEMYQEDPKFFIDGFFDMYYKLKRKETIDVMCNGDKEAIKQTWAALNFFKKMVEERKNPDEAAIIACKHYKLSIDQLHTLMAKFKAFRGAKKTKFKDLI